MISTEREANEFLYLAMDVGEQMLKSGAEVSRVEDTIQRICTSFGAERVDVFTITSSIVVTMYNPEFGPVTQTRRISGQELDLHRLEKLNQLSREICEGKLKIEEIKYRMERILQTNTYSFVTQLMIFALISGSFSLFFGGSIRDAIASAMVGVLLKCLISLQKILKINVFLAILTTSFLGGVLAIAYVRIGIGETSAKISIGNIMLLIPGLALTNALRDMFSGDTISGALRFTEAILTAVTVAFGFAVAAFIGGALV